MDKKRFIDINKYVADAIAGTEFEDNVYAVGGSVRDYVMEQEIKDIDYVVSLPNGGIRLAEFLDNKGLASTPVVKYERYGTAMVKLSEFPNENIEFVQTRSEKYSKDSRNPDTEYSSIEEDAVRRDLTINALYFNISTDKIIDPTGWGMFDIENHVIRTTTDPDKVFEDDPLRILRVIRFAARFGWSIDDDIMDSIVGNRSRLSIISKERILDELTKMLNGNHPGYAMQEIFEAGLEKYIFGKGNTYLKDNIFKVSNILNSILPFSDKYSKEYGVKLRRLPVMLYVIMKYMVDIVKSDSMDILRLMKVDNKTAKETCQLLTLSKADIVSKCMYDADRRRFMYLYGRTNLVTILLVEKIKITIDANLEFDTDAMIGVRMIDNLIRRCDDDDENGIFKYDQKLPIDGNDIIDYIHPNMVEDVGKIFVVAWDIMFKNPSISKEDMLDTLKSIYDENYNFNNIMCEKREKLDVRHKCNGCLWYGQKDICDESVCIPNELSVEAKKGKLKKKINNIKNI